MKILQIAYYYPPMGGAGVQRALKFSKYLPRHGITPIVIACDDSHYVRDESLLRDIPTGTEVHRIKFSPLMSRLISKTHQKNTPPQKKIDTAKFKLFTRIHQAIRNLTLHAIRTLQIPDEASYWARETLKHARAVINDHARQGEPINLILSSSPPVSSHRVAEVLAKEFDLPWIADYRDLWTENPAYALPKWRRAYDVHTEKRWLTRAIGIVTVTPTWQRMLTVRTLSRTPVEMIPNGYDEEDFGNLTVKQSPPDAFTIVHTGTFYGPRGPEALLEGIEIYISKFPTDPNRPKLRVRLVGNMGARFSDALRTFQNRHPGILEVIPYMPHSQALSELMSADALLLVVGSGDGEAVRGWLPGKIFEYLRAGKPILTIGDPEGDAAQLVKQHSHGIVVHSGDTEGLARALDVLVSGRIAHPPLANERSSHTVFERKELARQFARFIRECHARHLRQQGK